MRTVVGNFDITKRGISPFYLIFLNRRSRNTVLAFVCYKIHIVIGLCKELNTFMCNGQTATVVRT